jgi:transcription initiation factor TFIIE subunit alpha
VLTVVQSYARSETREGAQKPITKEYYYIDYRRAVDSIKYRIHAIDESVKASNKPTAEKKDLICPRCKAQWGLMEVLDNPDPQGRGFMCPKCDGILKNKETKEEDQPENDDELARFNKQFGPFLSLLQQVDETVIPAVTGESALADARPLPRDELRNPAARSTPVNEPVVRPTAVRGITTGPEKIEINLMTNSETSAADYAAEQERRAKVAAQNQLPEWHIKSTISGEATGKGKDDVRDPNLHDIPLKHEDDDDDIKKEDSSALDAYYAALQAEQERKAKEEEEEEEEDEDEDEDEFEDVTTAPAPAAETNGDAEPDAKRIKVEDSKPAVVSSAGGDESDEDDEFEDAL